MTQLTIPDYTKSGWLWTESDFLINYGSDIDWPKISIITPSFNQGQFIEDTIRSVLLQNYPNLEYIVMDGGSNDQTIDILKKYDPWISYWVSEPDKGQTHAINKGFKIATGEVINWLNSDDLLYPGALEKLGRHFAQNPSTHFLYGQCIHFDENGDFPHQDSPQSKNDLLKRKLDYLAGFPYSQPACFYRKSVLEQIGYLDESFHFTMDYDLFVRIALNYQMEQCFDFFAKFRHHEAAKTSTEWDIYFQDQIKVFSRIVRSIGEPEYIATLKRFDLYHEAKTTYPIRSSNYSAYEYRLAVATFLYHIASLYLTKLELHKSKALLKYIKVFEPSFLRLFDKNHLYFKSHLPPFVVQHLRVLRQKLTTIYT